MLHPLSKTSLVYAKQVTKSKVNTRLILLFLHKYNSEQMKKSYDTPEVCIPEMDNNNAITEAAYDSPGLSPGKYNSYDTNKQVKGVDETKIIKFNDI